MDHLQYDFLKEDKMGRQKFSFGKRAKSFKYAFDGLKLLLRNEHNSRIHLFVAVCVVVADFVSPRRHEAIKRVKDLAAAAVLVAAFAVAVIGAIIFIPKILALFV